MTLTELESKNIKEYVKRIKPDNDFRISVASDRVNIKLSKTANDILTTYVGEHKKKYGQIGKAAYIRMLLNQFYREQKALFFLNSVDLVEYNKTTLKALQIAKKLFRQYCDPTISTQSDAVVALLIYTTVRTHEVNNNLPTTDYLDRDFASRVEDGEIKITPLNDPLANIKDLFEENQDLALPIGKVK